MASERQRAIAKASLLLGSIPGDEVDLLLARAHWHRYDRGASLFLQGDQASHVHVVIDGWVKLFRIAPNGSEAVVSVFTRGESFGEVVALRALDYPVSAEAVSDCEVLHIPADAITTMMRRDPEISISVMAAIFQHLHSLVSQLEQLKAQTGAQRVAEFLLGLTGTEQGPATVTLPYDKVLIAGRLGMKPESLSRAFSKLKVHGVRIAGTHAAIEDVDRLRSYARIDPADAWARPF